MVEKHFKCSTFLAIGEMKIKDALRFRLTPLRMAKINNISDNSHQQGCESTNLYCHYGNQYGSSSESLVSIFLKVRLYYFWAYTQRTLYHITRTRICSFMFVSALLLMIRTWKQPGCPSVEEWIKKMWYTYTIEYYSVIKKYHHEIYKQTDRTRKKSS